MSDTNTLFIAAAKGKFRFPSTVGLLSAEDLFDLPLSSAKGASLDSTAKALYRALKDADDEISFVKPAVKTTTELQAKLDIVKYVIDVRVAERDARAVAEERSALRQRLMEKVAQKKDKDLDEKSAEELQAMIDELAK